MLCLSEEKNKPSHPRKRTTQNGMAPFLLAAAGCVVRYHDVALQACDGSKGMNRCRHVYIVDKKGATMQHVEDSERNCALLAVHCYEPNSNAP